MPERAMLRIDSANATDLDRLHPWLDAEAGDLPTAIRHGISVALEEAVMNVAMHAFPAGESGEIAVALHAAPDGVTLVVEDTGREFDPTTAPSAARPASLSEAEPGGLGLTLLRHYCDNIRYERVAARNRLTLRFRS
jgi:serine/threonine-protein kinase RsbW